MSVAEDGRQAMHLGIQKSKEKHNDPPEIA
jgi:hypothetical protein